MTIKLTAILMMFSFLQAAASGYAQKKVTLSENNVSLEKVLKSITKQTNYDLVFISTDIRNAKPITIKVNNVPLDEALKLCFVNQPFEYSLDTKTIIVSEKQRTIVSEILKAIGITGQVLDETGQPLTGASVRELGVTGNAVQTNNKGEFKLNVAGTESSIVISFIGYNSQTVKVGSEKNFTIKMKPNETMLKDAVIIGYQKQSMRKTTSAVQMITGKQIENLPAPSFESLLQGRVAGVNIQNFTGEPGARNTFTVRGNTTISTDLNSEIDLANTLSSPLYIIDGIPISITDLAGSNATGSNAIAGINVNDIESIVVQKDAAATAVWGSRGANGVIVIKTKKGLTGSPVIRLSYYTGVTQRPELQRTVAGAEERRQKMGLLSEYGTYNQLANIPLMLTDSLNPSYNNATDWQDLFYKSGRVSNYDVNISAGTDIMNYRLSLNYYDEDGIVRNTGFNRYSMRGNFDFKLSPKANSNLVISASRMNRKRGLGRGINQIVPISASSMPASFVKLADADYDFYYGQYDKLRDDNQTDQVSIYSQTDIDLFKGFRYSLQGSVSALLDNRDRFQPKELDANGVSFAESDHNINNSFYLANVLSYNKSFGEGKHNLSVVGIQSYDYTNVKQTYAYGSNIPTDDIHVVQGSPQRDIFGKSNLKKSAMLSFTGQLSYDYLSRYLVSASYRTDASSRFGKDTKWGDFPAVSVGWIASDESFLKDTKWLSMLKLRASYGLSGTQPTDFYAPFNVWSTPQTTYDGSSVAMPSFTKPLTLPTLTWNKSSQGNIGADIYLFDNRLNFTVDFYRKETKNPIFEFDFPFYTGYTRLSYNVPMKILNEGMDLSIQSRNLGKESPLQWTTSLNLSYNKNRIASLPYGNRSFSMSSRDYNQNLLFTVGSPIYGWSQMLYQGVYNRLTDIPVNPITGKILTYFKGNHLGIPGDPIWKDVNGDYDVWSDEDKGAQDGDLVPTGDPNPRFTGGIYNEFTWKRFSLGVLGIFTFKRDIINTFMSNQYANVLNFGGIENFANSRLPDLSKVDYWTPTKALDPNYNAAFPSLSPYSANYYQFLPFSTLWNEKGDYFKIKTITIGYQLDPKLVGKLGMKGVRVYGIMDNIMTFQSSSVPDAELVTPQGEYSGGSYPLPKKVTLGLEVTF
ncbi:SusC/RagA family TonB-linked outer membrane protein [Pedobacter steynii]